MWYKIDYNRLVLQLLPTFLRKPIIAAYVQSVVAPINSLYYTWSEFRNENLYKIDNTGQVCYLRKVLNDRFDPQQRRIYITGGKLYEQTYIYVEVELRDTYIYTEAESEDMYIRTEDETADTGYDFIVFVPIEIYDTQIYELRSLIDAYKMGGKQYLIYKIE